jgi:hypothetical protein
MRKKRQPGASEVLDLVDQDPSRGKVFWFLHAEHDGILARAQGKRIPWKALLAKVQALGLTNADGEPMEKVDSLRKTWMRVCALKQRQAEAKQQKAATSRRPTNDPPPLARPLPFTMPARSQPVPAVVTDDGIDDPVWLEILRRSNKRV